MIGAAGRSRVPDVAGERRPDIIGKDTTVDEIGKQCAELALPFPSMWFVVMLVADECLQVCHFMHEGDEEGVGVQIVVDRDLVSLAIGHRTVISKLARPSFCDFQMNVLLHDPAHADIDRRLGYILG